MKKIRKYLITGILTLLPLIITIYVTKFVFEFIDGFLEPLIVIKFGRQIPGIGFVLTLLLILLTGLTMSNYLGRRMITWLENLVTSLKLIVSGGVICPEYSEKC